MADEKKADVAVIGGGPGGYAAAFYAADLGLSTTLIDPDENPGGVCLHRGCIPSKALLHIAKLLEETKHAAEWGVTFEQPEIDIKKLRGWKDDVVKQLTGGVGQLMKQRNIDFFRGYATLLDNHTLEVKKHDGSKARVSFGNAIIATGSSPTKVPSFPDFSDRIMDSTSVLNLESVPKSLLVVGGGYIGLEMGTVYATLGSKVTVVEMMPTILPGVDKDLVRPLRKRLDSLFEDILLDTQVADMKEQKNGVKVTLKGDDIDKPERRFEKVLVSVGRKPNTKGIGIENTGVDLDDKGFVKVDEQRRTSQKHIFAIGDVAGEPMLAHKASHEGRIAAGVIAGHKVAFEPHAIPAVVFTDPEIAWCGITEDEAKDQGLEYDVARFPWAASGRAKTLGRSDGVTKLVVEKKTERVMGVGIAGPGAGELIGEGVLAVEMAAVVSDLGLSIHAHPTLSETIMEAADLIHGTATHYYKPRKKK